MADLPPAYESFVAQSSRKEVPTLFSQQSVSATTPSVASPTIAKKPLFGSSTTADDAVPVVYINDERFEIPATVGPLTSLAQFIRSRTKYTGTKISCGEGMCGACTVMLLSTNPSTGKQEAHGVNACLRPVLACAGMSVLTNDGLVSKDPKTLEFKFNAIQSALANHNGSQCGYCSNGFVMNMYDFLHNNPNPTALDIERAFDGNLCRCTGYRPILDAMQSFGPQSLLEKKMNNNKSAHDDCDEDDCRKKGCQRRQKVFPDLEDVQQFIKKNDDHFTSAHTMEKISRMKMPTSAPRSLRLAAKNSSNSGSLSVTNGVKDPFNNQWTWVSSIAELNSTLKALGPNSDALVVNGCTSFGVFTHDRSLTNANYLFIGGIEEMNRITSDSNNVYIGGAVTINTIITFLSSMAPIPNAPWKTKHFPQAIAHLKRIAGRQIRNAGSLAGNIVAVFKHQSPADFFASDGSIVLMGLGASVTIFDAINSQEYSLDMTAFFAQPEEQMVGRYISKIVIPLASSDNEVFMSYKIAMRQQGAEAIVNAAMRATRTPQGGIAANSNTVIAFGGIEARPRRYPTVEKVITGATSYSDIAFIKSTCQMLQDALNCEGLNGRVEFRTVTATNCLYKFFMALNPNLAPALVSGAEPWPTRPVSTGSQLFEPNPAMFPVSKAMIKVEAPFQTSGLAKYTNDLPQPERTLQARLVLATFANATVLSIDTSVAEQIPGFVRFVGAADMLPNTNTWTNGLIMTPIGGTVTYVGQVIGIVLCEDDVSAKMAALAVKIGYSGATANTITTIDEAIAANSYSTNVPPPVVRGDADTAFANAPLKVTGSVEIGPQQHFFMENHTATCIPREDQFEVQSATQMPVAVQMLCAQVAGVPTSRVTVTTKLVGGGFGGKITESQQVAALATIASAITGTAVTILVPQEQTSNTFGGRDIKRIEFKAGLDTDATFKALSITCYSASGVANTSEFGDSMVFLHSVDNCYNIPNVNFVAKILLTNYAPVASCRGPGWVHAVHSMEAIISYISKITGLDCGVIREKNFYKQGDTTPDGMPLTYWTLPSVWSQLKQSADFSGKAANILTFNSENRWRKRGLSMVPCRFGVGLAGANFDSLIAIYPDGTVTVNHGGNEIGQGLNTRLAQVVAYKFGISAENINVIAVKPTSTNVISAGSNVTGGSVTAEMCAASLIQAADTLLQRLEPFKKTGQTWAELIAAASAAAIPLTATGWTNAPNAEGIFNYNVCAASLVVAEVDILTGQTEIISTDMVYDCGLSTSPLLDIGQIEGGFIFGLGMLLTEELGWNNASGANNAPTHWKYKIPCSFTIPQEFNIALLKDAPNPLGVLGSKATGEPSVCMAISVPLAIESAITAARVAGGQSSDRWVCTKYPLTIDKSFLACGVSINDYTL